MFNKFLQGFFPHSSKEWCLLICLILSIFFLLLFYKALMNCKSTIESYVEEQRNFKAYYNISSDFINHCLMFEKGSIDSYLEDKNLSEVEFLTSLKKYGDDNARIL